MSLTVFAVVLFAAALHATWNAIVAGAADKVMTTVLVGGSAAAVALVAVPFVPPPAPASWPFILASGVIHVAYHALLANAYRTGDLSRMYPLMRGAAPLIVTVASALVLSETLTVLGWTGVAPHLIRHPEPRIRRVAGHARNRRHRIRSGQRRRDRELHAGRRGRRPPVGFARWLYRLAHRAERRSPYRLGARCPPRRLLRARQDQAPSGPDRWPRNSLSPTASRSGP